MRFETIIACLPLPLVPVMASGAALSHHGGLILDCTPPLFFEESPANDSSVEIFDRFSFTASDNTDGATLKIWVDGKPVAPTITPQRSGRLTVEGRPDAPIGQPGSRVRILVSGFSKDGCERSHAYYVHVRPKG
ncbi:hypothetical protein MCA0525 [Methylococcus capsulatus str. Bath]|jgi:hypothetical protein|uniref:Lipoprotein n=2 Tax=Methylococcus capsulatus TaxID=414 RepID=G1UBD2_METCA|nr:hypothetical protein [Methylococcus capsulatus]AAD03547.1 putative periplasmic protein [Methylococcus capsulatus str. Bath]AAU93286.1 hypothetical protein MCA0525 [Methylococcus capsulatus str. Bath]